MSENREANQDSRGCPSHEKEKHKSDFLRFVFGTIFVTVVLAILSWMIQNSYHDDQTTRQDIFNRKEAWANQVSLRLAELSYIAPILIETDYENRGLLVENVDKLLPLIRSSSVKKYLRELKSVATEFDGRMRAIRSKVDPDASESVRALLDKNIADLEREEAERLASIKVEYADDIKLGEDGME